MQNKKLPIRKFVSYLNNEEAEGGGFWLPNIQRPFVWSEEQITRLFDSIMREYPIGALLIWKTKVTVKHRKFIDNYHRDIRLTEFYAAENQHSKMLVLDGQQRLQSLFIGLKGSYSGTDRELYFDVLSGNVAAPEDIRWRSDKSTLFCSDKLIFLTKACRDGFIFQVVVFCFYGRTATGRKG